jgi:hypothetical protein
MLLSHIKNAILQKCTASFKVPDDELLQSILHEASLYVCSMCSPSELIREDKTFELDYVKVYRLIEGGKYIKVPEYPDLSKPERHLQIDEALTYAVIYYACFIVGKMKDFGLKKQCDDIIGVYATNFSNVEYER